MPAGSPSVTVPSTVTARWRVVWTVGGDRHAPDVRTQPVGRVGVVAGPGGGSAADG